MLTDNNSIPPTRTAGQELDPVQTEDMAIRLIFNGDPMALACHKLGLESRAQPMALRLHPDDVALIARQVAVEINLGEQAAQAARNAQNGAQRYTGTALGDRAAAGRKHDPYPIHTAEELNEIENNRGAAA